MKTQNQKIRHLAEFLIIVAIFYFVLKVVLLPAVTSDTFRQFTESLGIWGYLIIISYVVLSHIFAPIAGTPGVALGVTIYGIKTGMWLLYFGSLVSATANFAISRKFGRPWVIKLVGKKSMEKVDEFALVEGKQVMIVSRLIGFSLFDFISYAAGLTQIHFRDYFLITAVFGLIPNILIQFVFRDLDFQSDQGIIIWIASVASAGLVFGGIMHHYIKKHKN